MSPKFSRLVSALIDTSSARIGILYLVTCALYAMLGIAAAILIQIDMLSPVTQATGALWFGKLLTGHGMLMVFLVLLPLFPGVFGHLVVPSAVSASGSPSSKTGYFGWHCHVGAGVLIVVSLFMNAYDAGWIMMMPVAGFSVPHVLLLIGLLLAALATLLPSVAVIRMVLSRRVRTIPLSQLPIFAWLLLIGSLLQVSVTPIRLYTLVAMLGSHLSEWTSFSLTTPEGITLYQKFFWFYAGPATLGLILPAFGVIYEVLVARSRPAVQSRTAIVSSGIAISILAIASWSQHLAATADGEFAMLLGSFFGLLIVLPVSFILLRLIRLLSLLKRPVTSSVLFAFSAVACGLLAGIAGATLAIPALAIHLHNTYFTVAHLHLALAGSVGGAIVAGLFHFWPHWWQTMYSERMAKASAFGMLCAICLTFLPMTLIGAQGLPRALYTYPAEFHILHVISSIGSILLVASFILAFTTLALGFRHRGEAKLTMTLPNGEFTYVPIFPESTRR